MIFVVLFQLLTGVASLAFTVSLVLNVAIYVIHAAK